MANTGFEPHVLKIDTETNEPHILTGAQETIAILRPGIVEVLADRTREGLMNVLAPFEHLWYRIDDTLPPTASRRDRWGSNLREHELAPCTEATGQRILDGDGTMERIARILCSFAGFNAGIAGSGASASSPRIDHFAPA